jgi:colicin import membrane protein
MKKILLLGSALLFCGIMSAQTKTTQTTSKSVTVKKDVKDPAVTPEPANADAKVTTTATTKEVKTTAVKEGETYKGKKVFKDTKGKRYYLNSNGNKTYIDK